MNFNKYYVPKQGRKKYPDNNAEKKSKQQMSDILVALFIKVKKMNKATKILMIIWMALAAFNLVSCFIPTTLWMNIINVIFGGFNIVTSISMIVMLIMDKKYRRS